MGKIELFVVGASAGGLKALKKAVSRLPADFPAAICAVMHVAPDSPGLAPELLSGMGPLPARHARHDETLAAGRIGSRLRAPRRRASAAVRATPTPWKASLRQPTRALRNISGAPSARWRDQPRSTIGWCANSPAPTRLARAKALAAAEQARRLAALVRAAVKQDVPAREKAP
jgi:hypothetical protein